MGRVQRYLSVLRVRAARGPFVASVVGRLPISMAPLAAVLLVQQVRGSYSIAGLVTGMYALGAAVGTPVLGRFVDRLGQPRVVGPAGVVSAALLAALALAAAGGARHPVLLALAPPAGAAAPPHGTAPHPLSVAGVRTVLLTSLLVSLGFAHLDLSIAATAREALAEPGRVGLLFACFAGGSTVGGLVYGSRSWRLAERLRLPLSLTAVATGLAVVAVHLGGLEGRVRTPSLPVLAALLFASGVAITPGLIAVNNLVDALAPRSRLSEAQAWVSTSYTGGGAARPAR